MATIKAGQTEVGKFYVTRTGQVVKILSVGESQVECLATATNKMVKIPAALEFAGEFDGPVADVQEEVEEEDMTTSVPTEEVEATPEEEEVEATPEEEVEEEDMTTSVPTEEVEEEDMTTSVPTEEVEATPEEEVEATPGEEVEATPEEEVEATPEEEVEEEATPEAVLVEPEEKEVEAAPEEKEVEEAADETAVKEVVDKAKQTIAEMVEPLPEKVRRAVYSKLAKAIQSKSKTAQVTHETSGAPVKVRTGSVKDRVIQLMSDGQTRTVSEMAKAVDARYQQVFGILDSLSDLLDTVAAPEGSRAKCAYVKK